MLTAKKYSTGTIELLGDGKKFIDISPEIMSGIAQCRETKQPTLIATNGYGWAIIFPRNYDADAKPCGVHPDFRDISISLILKLNSYVVQGQK